MASASRLRIPAGYAGFRQDLGEFIARRRKAMVGKQQTLADAIGIARPSLSSIETGKAWPLPDTLEGLMRELSLTWDMVLLRGGSDRPARPVDGGPRASQRLDLGRDLREGRQREGLKLWQVAGRCGLSVAQLSRIERGEASRSRAFEDDPDDAALPREYRGMRFRHPELRRLSTPVG